MFMGLKSDSWIREKALKEKMVGPFCEDQVGKGVVSYGLRSYGYDIRVSDEFKIFTNVNAEVVDPKHFDERNVVDVKGDVCIVPPNSFALARTVEYFRMPRNVLAICLGKSTYARCGIIVNVTPFEPGFEGTSPSRSPTPPPSRRRSTPTKGSPRCSSSRGTNPAKPPTPTAGASISSRPASPSPGSSKTPKAPFSGSATSPACREERGAGGTFPGGLSLPETPAARRRRSPAPPAPAGSAPAPLPPGSTR